MQNDNVELAHKKRNVVINYLCEIRWEYITTTITSAIGQKDVWFKNLHVQITNHLQQDLLDWSNQSKGLEYQFWYDNHKIAHDGLLTTEISTISFQTFHWWVDISKVRVKAHHNCRNYWQNNGDQGTIRMWLVDMKHDNQLNDTC